MKPILIDLFCGAGGAAKGYQDAGFEVVGVDHKKQPRFPGRFIRDDWESVLNILPGIYERSNRPYVIHASPPCQRYSRLSKMRGLHEQHPDLIDPVRQRLLEIGAPYIIENVVGAPLNGATFLCGSMFALRLGRGKYYLRRHRLFETSFKITARRPMCAHRGESVQVYGHTGGSSKKKGIKLFSREDWQEALQIDWMTNAEMAESIPPAYTRWLGKLLMQQLPKKEKRKYVKQSQWWVR